MHTQSRIGCMHKCIHARTQRYIVHGPMFVCMTPSTHTYIYIYIYIYLCVWDTQKHVKQRYVCTCIHASMSRHAHAYASVGFGLGAYRKSYAVLMHLCMGFETSYNLQLMFRWACAAAYQDLNLQCQWEQWYIWICVPCVAKSWWYLSMVDARTSWCNADWKG
jgi:hypothetical protein